MLLNERGRIVKLAFVAYIATSPLTGSGFSVLQNNFANVSSALGKMGGKGVQRRYRPNKCIQCSLLFEVKHLITLKGDKSPTSKHQFL